MGKIKSIKELIFQYFKSAGLEDKFEQYYALAYWQKVVGKEIARHTEPFRVQDGVIFVQVDSDVWRTELQYMKPEIIEKLNHELKKTVIQDIKFY